MLTQLQKTLVFMYSCSISGTVSLCIVLFRKKNQSFFNRFYEKASIFCALQLDRFIVLLPLERKSVHLKQRYLGRVLYLQPVYDQPETK